MDDNERRGLLAVGFMLGALAGGAAVAMMAADDRKEITRKARGKFDQLTAGRTIQEVTDSIRGGVRQVVDEIAKTNRRFTREIGQNTLKDR